MGYQIAELPLRRGMIGISPLPGREGRLEADLSVLLGWGAELVLTMNPIEELRYARADRLGEELAMADVTWRHLPVPDFGAPPPETDELWAEASEVSHRVLEEGGRVLAHCFAGCGRSGMAVLRLMVEAGEEPDSALARLRQVRPCAVEREAQFTWASRPWDAARR